MANKRSPCISVISDSFSLIAKTSASLLGNDVLKSVVLLHDLPLHTHIHIRAEFIMRKNEKQNATQDDDLKQETLEDYPNIHWQRRSYKTHITSAQVVKKNKKSTTVNSWTIILGPNISLETVMFLLPLLLAQ